MKTSHGILIVVIILIAIGIFAWSNKNADVVDNTPPTGQIASIEGCYVAHIEQKDVYTLRVESQQGTSVSGKISFKNYEKDSSSGTFVGTYENGILLGEYAFNSEGMSSVMQVIFKKTTDGFVRGYGPVDTEGTRFSDLSAITYDTSSPLAVFNKGACTN